MGYGEATCECGSKFQRTGPRDVRCPDCKAKQVKVKVKKKEPVVLDSPAITVKKNIADEIECLINRELSKRLNGFLLTMRDSLQEIATAPLVKVPGHIDNLTRDINEWLIKSDTNDGIGS